jgi:hypothetical protein
MNNLGLLRDVPELPTVDIRWKMLGGSRAFLQSSSFTALSLPPPNHVLVVCWNKEADGRARGSLFFFAGTPDVNAVTLNAAGPNDVGGIGDDEEVAVSTVDDRLKPLEWGRPFLQPSSFTTLSLGFFLNKEGCGIADGSPWRRIVLISDDKSSSMVKVILDITWFTFCVFYIVPLTTRPHSPPSIHPRSSNTSKYLAVPSNFAHAIVRLC